MINRTTFRVAGLSAALLLLLAACGEPTGEQSDQSAVPPASDQSTTAMTPTPGADQPNGTDTSTQQ